MIPILDPGLRFQSLILIPDFQSYQPQVQGEPPWLQPGEAAQAPRHPLLPRDAPRPPRPRPQCHLHLLWTQRWMVLLCRQSWHRVKSGQYSDGYIVTDNWMMYLNETYVLGKYLDETYILGYQLGGRLSKICSAH